MIIKLEQTVQFKNSSLIHEYIYISCAENVHICPKILCAKFGVPSSKFTDAHSP